MRHLFLLLFCATLHASPSFAQTNGQHQETAYVPGEVLIQLNHGYTVDQLVSVLQTSTGLKTVKELSHHMRIWQLSFDHTRIGHAEMLHQLKALKMVRLAQNNHYIEERATVPNDPNFANQWHHKNTAASGGIADADIDSDEAWDITTGGITAEGDTIVVALLESPGAYFNHPDLKANFWRNYNEIDGNGIDDDGNGYTDDFNGWNVNANNDNHFTGGHGTQCMGMIAARGNNSLGVTGASWRTKVMLISGFSINEAGVINAYDYPLTMRKLYNQTNGANGAFVVATTASWGIDGADPVDYPLWCAFYDTLGVHGILNVGATTNSTVNVDINGDMPTTCSSDYLVAVTRTGNADNQAGGFGAASIDFGAPGINVFTTSGNSSGSASYGSTTGTSFSAPLTAGVIGLIYSVPCPWFIDMVKADPQGGADYVRQLLLDNVDPVPSMSGKSVTGGRLNAYGPVHELLTSCPFTVCPQPFGIAVSDHTTGGGTVSWFIAGSSPSGFYYYYRPVGATDWDSVSVDTNVITITGLDSCTMYELKVATDCGSELSGYSPVITFLTNGCCTTPTGLEATPLTFTSAQVNFDTIVAAQSYNIRYRELGSPTWTVVNITSVPYTLAGLDSCMGYELQVQTVCVSTTTAFSVSDTFNTSGCGFCEDTPYCTSAGASVADEYLARVQIAGIDRISGPDGGYVFTGESSNMLRGGTYNIGLTPGFTGSTQVEYFSAWIDYDQSGSFEDPAERIYSSGAGVTAPVTSTFTVPMTATFGTTRMRVSMKYYGAGDMVPPFPCTSFAFGEVEDYCININGTISTNDLPGAEVVYALYPNPASESVLLDIYNFAEFNGGKNTIAIYNTVGELINTSIITGKSTTIDLSVFSNGIYHYVINLSGKTTRTGRLVVSK